MLAMYIRQMSDGVKCIRGNRQNWTGVLKSLICAGVLLADFVVSSLWLIVRVASRDARANCTVVQIVGADTSVTCVELKQRCGTAHLYPLTCPRIPAAGRYVIHFAAHILRSVVPFGFGARAPRMRIGMRGLWTTLDLHSSNLPLSENDKR